MEDFLIKNVEDLQFLQKQVLQFFFLLKSSLVC